MKKQYIIVGSNNFWYAMCDSLKEAQAEAKKIIKYKDRFDEGNPNYCDEESSHHPFTPNELYIYEALEVKRITNE